MPASASRAPARAPAGWRSASTARSPTRPRQGRWTSPSASSSTTGTVRSSPGWCSASSTVRPSPPAPSPPSPRPRSGRAGSRPRPTLRWSPCRRRRRTWRGAAVVDRRGRSGVATVAALASSGEPVLAVCADALRSAGRWSSARPSPRASAAAPWRWPPRPHADEKVGAGGRARSPRRAGSRSPTGRGSSANPAWPRGFEHVVLIDPPPAPALERLVDRSGPGGFLHLAWGPGRGRVRPAGLGRPVALTPALGGPLPRPAGARRGRRRYRGAPRCARRSPGEGAHPRSPEVAGAPPARALELSWASVAHGLPAPSRGPRRRILGGDRPGAIAGVHRLPRPI